MATGRKPEARLLGEAWMAELSNAARQNMPAQRYEPFVIQLWGIL